MRLVKLLLERRIQDVDQLLAVLEVEITVTPRGAQCLKRGIIHALRRLIDKLDVVLGYTIAERMVLVGERLRIELDEIVQAGEVVAVVSVFVGEALEFFIHVRVEVADEEVAPELVQDAELRRACSSHGLCTLL